MLVDDLYESRLVRTLFAFFFAGLFLGFVAAAFLVYEPRIAALQSKLSTTQNELSKLDADYIALIGNYSAIISIYSDLDLAQFNLIIQRNLLTSYFRSLNDSYNDLKEYYKGLSKNVSDLYDLLYSYSRIPQAFSRTLNEVAISKTETAVMSATSGSTDIWSSYEKIYQYIVTNIAYAEDIDMPYPSTYWHINIGESDFITNFTMTSYRNYVQTPDLTLSIKQGDCDDQAVLAYAMIKYYMKYVVGSEDLLYIAQADLDDGTSHLAVFVPVQGGELCILDPSSDYLTSTWSGFTSKQALLELRNYSSYWYPNSITHITLYNIDVTNGSYSIIGEGTIEDVAAILGLP
jgi:hypothetical protein